MIRRLCTLSVDLIVVFAVLISGTIIFGRAHGSNELQTWGFETCDGIPCYNEITPGVTTVQQAQAVIDRPVNMNQTDNCGSSASFDRDILRSYISCKNNLVSEVNVFPIPEISINPDHHDFFSSLDQLISLYGAPCQLFLQESVRFNWTLFLTYPFMEVRITVLPGTPTMGSHIR